MVQVEVWCGLPRSSQYKWPCVSACLYMVDVEGGKRRKNTDVCVDENEDDSDPDTESWGVVFGRLCGYCLLNHYDIPVFLISFIILYLSVDRCCYCVVVVAIMSALLCMRFPVLNAPLWSALVVLYFHKDWNVNFGNLRFHWSRAP